MKPALVVLVNDGSTDHTTQIATEFDVKIVDCPIKHKESWVIKKELAIVFNAGLELFDDSFDYVTIIGGDEIIPNNHFEYITNKMNLDPSVMIASGQIMNEPSTIPRGSGRIVRWRWWQSIGGLYPINYGYESWLIAKCKSKGFNHKVFDEIVSKIQRPTGTGYKDEKFYHKGQAFKALGYNKRFVFARSLILVVKGHHIIAPLKIIQGFLSRNVELYDKDVRKYYTDYQNAQCSLSNIPKLLRAFQNHKGFP